MKTLYFKCELLTDVILNQRAATEGGQETLDFIPGNNFLGIVAGQLHNQLMPEESLLLFHSGKVCFGDAHPEKNGKYSLKIPASMYKPKLGDMREKGLYIHHAVTDPDSPDYKNFQPKQCRTGFYLFENEQMEEVKVEKSYAQKSAYDSKMRRSADEMMFGYEALQEGSSWLFDVTIDDDTFEDKIKKSLIGTKHIGRSRTAQYGLVKIEYLESGNVDKNNVKPLYNAEDKNNYILIYAESRLIFLDDFGLPTFQPKVKDLGFPESEIIWEKSQIRTFQYAPWNSKRQVRDADRCGIEKGSVFYVKITSDEEIIAQPFIGVYQNEGFGKVIYNPEFMNVTPDSNGKALYKFQLQQESKKNDITRGKSDIHDTDRGLLRYLKIQNNNDISEREILKKVNIFVKENKIKYTSESFASQWGTIRSIAMQYKTKADIIKSLFGETYNVNTDSTNNKEEANTAYLLHGIAEDKWNDRGKRKDLYAFMNQFDDKYFRPAIINLCSEMAKISKK